MHARHAEIVAAAKALVGAPYRHQGRDPESGIDCIGLPAYIGKTLGLSDHNFTAYARLPDARQFKKHLLIAGCTMIPHRDKADGDLLQMSFARWPVHCGVLEVDEAGTEWLIHATRMYKKVKREPLSDLHEGRVMLAWRFPGDSHG